MSNRAGGSSPPDTPSTTTSQPTSSTSNTASSYLGNQATSSPRSPGGTGSMTTTSASKGANQHPHPHPVGSGGSGGGVSSSSGFGGVTPGVSTHLHPSHTYPHPHPHLSHATLPHGQSSWSSQLSQVVHAAPLVRIRAEMLAHCLYPGDLLNLSRVSFLELMAITPLGMPALGITVSQQEKKDDKSSGSQSPARAYSPKQLRDVRNETLSWPTWLKIVKEFFLTRAISPQAPGPSLDAHATRVAKFYFDRFAIGHPSQTRRANLRTSHSVDLSEFLIFLYIQKFVLPEAFSIGPNAQVPNSQSTTNQSSKDSTATLTRAIKPPSNSPISHLPLPPPSTLPAPVRAAQLELPPALAALDDRSRWVCQHLPYLLCLTLASAKRQVLATDITPKPLIAPPPGATAAAIAAAASMNGDKDKEKAEDKKEKIAPPLSSVSVEPHELSRLGYVVEALSSKQIPSISLYATVTAMALGITSPSASGSSAGPSQGNESTQVGTSASSSLVVPTVSAVTQPSQANDPLITVPLPPLIRSSDWEAVSPARLSFETCLEWLKHSIAASVSRRRLSIYPTTPPGTTSSSSPGGSATTGSSTPSSPVQTPTTIGAAAARAPATAVPDISIPLGHMPSSPVVTIPSRPYVPIPTYISTFSSGLLISQDNFFASQSSQSSEKEGEHVVLTCSAALASSITLEDCTGITLVNNCCRPFVTLCSVSDATLQLGVVTRGLTLRNCSDVSLTVAARSITIENCRNVTLHVYTPMPPVVLGHKDVESLNITLAPHNAVYPGLLRDAIAAGFLSTIIPPHVNELTDPAGAAAVTAASQNPRYTEEKNSWNVVEALVNVPQSMHQPAPSMLVTVSPTIPSSLTDTSSLPSSIRPVIPNQSPLAIALKGAIKLLQPNRFFPTNGLFRVPAPIANHPLAAKHCPFLLPKEYDAANVARTTKLIENRTALTSALSTLSPSQRAKVDSLLKSEVERWTFNQLRVASRKHVLNLESVDIDGKALLASGNVPTSSSYHASNGSNSPVLSQHTILGSTMSSSLSAASHSTSPSSSALAIPSNSAMTAPSSNNSP